MEDANATSVAPEAASQEPAQPTPSEQVAPTEAEGTDNTQAPGAELQLDEATQKYLANQNISGTPSEMVSELVKRNQAFRNEPKETKETKQKTEAVAEVLKADSAAETPAHPTGLSDLDIANVALIVQNQYKDVKVDAQFYKDMIADGFKPVGDDGEIKLRNVTRYAAYKQKLAEAEKAIESNPTPIPSPTNAIDNEPTAPVKEMTTLAAQNIVLFSNKEKRFGRAPHPQYEEAVKFLQDETRK